MKQKTHKGASKRFKVTKNGKLLKRAAGQDHFNSRDTGVQTKRKRRDTNMSESYRHSLKSLLPNHDV